MTQSQRFSCGIVQAPFVVSSGLLPKAWSVISSLDGNGLFWKVHEEQDLTVLAFGVKPDFDPKQDTVSSSELSKSMFDLFKFLCSTKIPVFSVNKSAISLFGQNLERLHELKSKIDSSPRLIVTGHGLGGSIASLFTLSLLDSTGPGKKHRLCITFGSPLVGDKNLQEAISRSSTWSSCFLHVVSYKDPLPTKFNPHTTSYMPFGTFLFCSESEINSTCFENPESVKELLVNSIHHQNQGVQPIDYGEIVGNLYRKAIYKNFTPGAQDFTHYDSLRASISLQLLALGLTSNLQQQQQNFDLNTLVIKMEQLEEKFIKKGRKFDPSTKLNALKIEMVKFEWYKKDAKTRNIGYYDSYRNGTSNSTIDQDVITFRKKLTNYWEAMVEEAEMKPQTEGAAFRTRWLYGGTNYRRMVEPLDIAEYYKNGGKDYVQNQRSRHYKVLEEWLEEGKKDTSDSNSSSRKNVELILTIDSCFWAHVEEALLLCKQLQNVESSVTEKEEATKKLLEFEEYVYGLLNRYQVSPEIFLEKSSYMKWWNQYEGISGKPALASFMNNPLHYDQYKEGNYIFP
ncbi:Senescence-associated carboxylesterase 101, partial [Mucuna pruriens]